MKNTLVWAAAASLVASPTVAKPSKSVVSVGRPTPAASTAPVAPVATAAEPAAVPVVAPVATPVAAPTGDNILPANTDVMLSMDQELNSKTSKMGDRFNMTVVHNVVSNGLVVIPAGTRASGEVTFHTNKGSFGKSGKMEIELKHLELGGQRIPITGKYRQEGEGNTTATVAAVVLVGVFSALVTGKSAVIPQGRELLVQTDVAVSYDPATATKAKPLSVASQPAAVAPAAAPAATPAAAPATSPATSTTAANPGATAVTVAAPPSN